MRRTQQEFKAEVFRRSSAYRQRRKAQYMKALTGIACMVIVILGIGMLPNGFVGSVTQGADSGNMAEVMMDSKVEEPMGPEAPAEAPAAGEQREEQVVNTIASAIYIECIADGTKQSLGLGEGELMAQFLAGTEWALVRHKCTSEYVIMDPWGKPYGYRPDCGALYDPQTELHSEPLPEDIREILDKYCN